MISKCDTKLLEEISAKLEPMSDAEARKQMGYWKSQCQLILTRKLRAQAVMTHLNSLDLDDPEGFEVCEVEDQVSLWYSSYQERQEKQLQYAEHYYFAISVMIDEPGDGDAIEAGILGC